MSKQPMRSLRINQPPSTGEYGVVTRPPGALTVTFVDLEEIRAVALRQCSGKFYEELSVVGAQDARKQERISQAVIHGPKKNPSLYRSAPCLICIWAVNKS